MNYDEAVIAESKKRYPIVTERDAFLDGVQWCEEHPAWRMCKEQLPKKPCECVCHDGKRRFLAKWVDDRPQGVCGWEINGITREPIAWLPIPKFDLKDEEE